MAAVSASEETPNCSKPYSMNYEDFYSLLQPFSLQVLFLQTLLLFEGYHVYVLFRNTESIVMRSE